MPTADNKKIFLSTETKKYPYYYISPILFSDLNSFLQWEENILPLLSVIESSFIPCFVKARHKEYVTYYDIYREEGEFINYLAATHSHTFIQKKFPYVQVSGTHLVHDLKYAKDLVHRQLEAIRFKLTDQKHALYSTFNQPYLK